MSDKVCRNCGDELNDDNWYASRQKNYDYICNTCCLDMGRKWYGANPDKAKAIYTRRSRMMGKRPFDENRECPQFLGVHVAERVLRHVFNDVEVMPMNNPGYDIKCNRGKLIDSKSSCAGRNGRWMFFIDHNTIADYFVLLAFDNRDSINPLHCWMIPGYRINHLVGASISPSTIHKWDEYKLDITKISACCDIMRGN